MGLRRGQMRIPRLIQGRVSLSKQAQVSQKGVDCRPMIPIISRTPDSFSDTCIDAMLPFHRQAVENKETPQATRTWHTIFNVSVADTHAVATKKLLQTRTVDARLTSCCCCVQWSGRFTSQDCEMYLDKKDSILLVQGRHQICSPQKQGNGPQGSSE